MNTQTRVRYTNETSPELLKAQNTCPFTPERRANLSEETLKILQEADAYNGAHPPIAIYRFATEGSHTRDGGTIEKGTTELQIQLSDDCCVRVARKGDFVVYADGTSAQIATGAGRANSNIALVGSRLSNGDEIVDTPQNIAVYVVREGIALPDDFLA